METITGIDKKWILTLQNFPFYFLVQSYKACHPQHHCSKVSNKRSDSLHQVSDPKHDTMIPVL